MIELLKENLNMPEACIVDKKIFKKMFYENYKFTAQDKKIFKEDIVSIHWLYSVKPDNSNIAEYVDEVQEYKEVAFIAVEMKKITYSKKSIRIEEIIHRSIPYATVLLIYDGRGIVISCSTKRFSNSSKKELVTDEIVSTDIVSRKEYENYLKCFSYEQFNLSNLMQFNQSMLKKVIGVISLQKIGHRPKSIDDPNKKKKILDQIDNFEGKIASLKKELKVENQFKIKVEINVKIKNIETMIIELKKVIGD